MRVWVNGEERELSENITLGRLVRELGVERAVVVAEVNGGVIAKDRDEEVVLQPNDRVELIQFVGGG